MHSACTVVLLEVFPGCVVLQSENSARSALHIGMPTHTQGAGLSSCVVFRFRSPGPRLGLAAPDQGAHADATPASSSSSCRSPFETAVWHGSRYRPRQGSGWLGVGLACVSARANMYNAPMHCSRSQSRTFNHHGKACEEIEQKTKKKRLNVNWTQGRSKESPRYEAGVQCQQRDCPSYLGSEEWKRDRNWKTNFGSRVPTNAPLPVRLNCDTKDAITVCGAPRPYGLTRQ